MIIFRSFISQVLQITLVVTVVVVGLFLVLRGMIFLGQAADGLIPVSAVFSLVALAMVANLDVIFPLMVYIGLLMVLNRWYNDREMAVLASSGVGLFGFIKPLVLINLMMLVIIAILSLYLTPAALTKGYDLERKYRQSQEINGIQTGQFIDAKSSHAVYFVEGYDRQAAQYNNVFINQSSPEHEGLVKASRAYRTQDNKTNDQFLVLLNGTRYEGIAGATDYRIVEFEKYALRIEPPQHKKLYLPIKALPTTTVMHSADAKYHGEWIWRLAKIFVLPVLSIFALALSHVDSRSGKASGLVAAFLVYLCYSNFLGYAVALVKKDDVSSSLIVWCIHAVFASMAVYCLYRRNYNLPLIPTLQILKRAQSIKI